MSLKIPFTAIFIKPAQGKICIHVNAGRIQILLYFSVLHKKRSAHKDVINSSTTNFDIWVRDWSLMRGLCRFSLALEQKYTASNQIYMSSDLDTIRAHKKVMTAL